MPASRLKPTVPLLNERVKAKSHDIKWGIDRGFKDGTSGYLSFKCYGYRSDKQQGLLIETNEATIVQIIFNLRL